jgi:hypothetical protein
MCGADATRSQLSPIECVPRNRVMWLRFSNRAASVSERARSQATAGVCEVEDRQPRMISRGAALMARTIRLHQCDDGRLHKILETVAQKQERILVEFEGIKLAIIPPDDLALLEKLEEEALDRMDAQEAEEGLRDPKSVPWNQVKRQLKS